jgi:hypothetical protein
MRRAVRGKPCRLLCWALAGWLACALPASAQDASPEDVRELMELSGLNATLAGFPGMASAQARWRAADLPPELAERLDRAMIEAFAPERLRPRVEAVLGQGFRPGEVAKCLEWLRSPLGRRFYALEIAVNAPGQGEQFTEFVRELKSRPPARERIALIGRSLQAMGSVDTYADAAAIVAQPVVVTLDALAPKERRMNAEQILEVLGFFRDLVRPEIEWALAQRAFFAYRDVDDAELRQYVEFLESPPGRSLYAQIRHAMTVALRQSGNEVSKAFSEVVQ